jgi:hypothetical protein
MKRKRKYTLHQRDIRETLESFNLISPDGVLAFRKIFLLKHNIFIAKSFETRILDIKKNSITNQKDIPLRRAAAFGHLR